MIRGSKTEIDLEMLVKSQRSMSMGAFMRIQVVPEMASKIVEAMTVFMMVPIFTRGVP